MKTKPDKPNPAALDAIADRISWWLAERKVAQEKNGQKQKQVPRPRAKKKP